MALKKIKQGGIIPPIAVRELSVFQQLDHQNLIKLEGFCVDDSHRLNIKFKQLTMDLRKLLNDIPANQPFDQNLLRLYTFQVTFKVIALFY